MCSDFLAGDALRSSQRYKALDETAIFGTACRHEFPHRFVNLKHGERYGTCIIPFAITKHLFCTLHRLTYGVWLLTQIVDKQPVGIKIHLMYDIACNLVRHLKVEMHVYIDKNMHANVHIPQHPGE